MVIRSGSVVALEERLSNVTGDKKSSQVLWGVGGDPFGDPSFSNLANQHAVDGNTWHYSLSNPLMIPLSLFPRPGGCLLG